MHEKEYPSVQEEQRPVSNEVKRAKETLTGLNKTVVQWWRSLGYRYISGISFDESIRFWVRLGTIIDEIDGVDPKIQILELKKNGFRINGESADESYFIDCDDTRKSFSELIKKRFPSAKIMEWESRPTPFGSPDEFALTDIKIRISDIHDI